LLDEEAEEAKEVAPPEKVEKKPKMSLFGKRPDPNSEEDAESLDEPA